MKNSLVRNGAYLALAAALVSGVSVFVNSFGVKQVSDPFVFTTAKNALVALVFASLVLTPSAAKEITRLTKKQLGWLLVLGIVGGSIPFLLFFYGLREATAPSAAFVHKTLFIWVAILAVTFLGERLGRIQIAALGVLVLGNLVLIGRPAEWALGRAELFVLVATLMWAVEAIVAKRVMSGISVRTAALGRMGFGAIAMLAFLMASGRIDTLASMDGTQFAWVAITSVFLVGYVTSYYAALKHAPATLVSSVLVLGSVITSTLHIVYSGRTYSIEQLIGFILVAVAACLWLYVGARMVRTAKSTRETAYAGR